MKKFIKLFVTALIVALMAIPVIFAACGEPDKEDEEKIVDYTSELKLDMTTDTKKQEVSIRLYVDGDTTHFDPVTNSSLTPYNAADFEKTQGYIKARYIAINTPESTGKIEPWGKKASDFTHSKLEGAKSIIVESDTNTWNVDSTGERYVLWVWYMPADGTEYRNLNVEILQNGFAIASSTANNRYSVSGTSALAQAQKQKLNMFSGKDPDFPYGSAEIVTLKELRCHVKDYLQKKVRVEGVVTTEFNHSVYIEDYDPETGVYFGFAVYYAYQTGKILDQLAIGNRISVMGYVTEFQDTYQISGISYDEYNPSSPNNTNVVSKDNDAAYAQTDAKDIITGKLDVTFETKDPTTDEIKEEKVNINYGEAIMSSTVSLSNLTVTKVYTTNNGGQSDGAMSLTCRAADGTVITVRTEVLKENGVLVTADRYNGKTINVKGIIEKYDGNYQVKCYRADFITVL